MHLQDFYLSRGTDKMQLESYAMEKLKVPPRFCPGGSDFKLWQMEEM